jgi:hypothetical protein
MQNYNEEYNDSYKYIYGSIRSQIQLPQFVEINEILIPIGLEFVKFPIASNYIMLTFQIHKSYFYLDQLLTFFYDSTKLPIGLPIFDTTGQRLLGFVGEQINGYYAISGYPIQSVKLKVDNEPIINIQNEESSENKIVYGNMIAANDKDIDESLITTTNTTVRRINIVILQNKKFIINATNDETDVNAMELWSMKFSNSSKLTYLLNV